MSKIFKELSRSLMFGQETEDVIPSHDPQHPSALSMDYEEAFELTGHGLFSYLAQAACALIFIHGALEMAAIGYIITPAECDLRLSVTQKSLINSGIFVGILLTAIVWGSISDRFGRRKVMLPAVVGAVVTSFTSSLCSQFWSMLCLRILTGFLVSASSATVLVYLGELQTMKYRDFSITFTMALTQIVFILLPAIAWILIPRKWSFNIGSLTIRTWRMFMWLWGLVGLTGAGILFILPESPSFILASKGPFEALPILARMYALNHGKKNHDYPVTSMTTATLASGDGSFVSAMKDTIELIRHPIRRCFLITHYSMFILCFLSYGFYIWLPDFINDVAADVTLSESICDLINRKYLKKTRDGNAQQLTLRPIKDPDPGDCSKGDVHTSMYPMAMGMEFIYLIPFITMIFIIDKFDKKKIYAVIMLVCTIGLIVCCVIPQNLIALVSLIIGINCFTGASILSAYAVDAFPTSLRSLSMCTMYMMGHIGAIAGNNIISLMDGILCQILFILVAFSTIGSAGLIWFFWPDLKLVREEMESRNFSY